jgi:hypothetical protein
MLASLFQNFIAPGALPLVARLEEASHETNTSDTAFDAFFDFARSIRAPQRPRI